MPTGPVKVEEGRGLHSIWLELTEEDFQRNWELLQGYEEVEPLWAWEGAMGRPRKGEERHGTGILNIKSISLEGRDAVLHSSRVTGGILTIRENTFIGGPDDEFQPGGISNTGTLVDEGGNVIG